MDKNKLKLLLEQGQILPIVVISMIALIAMAALIVDGGALLLNRRAAQNAADAAALAGARELCGISPSESAIEGAIEEYTLKNNATLIEWDLTTASIGVIDDLVRGEVVVTVEVEHGSFFAPIFKLINNEEGGEEDYDFLTAQATAAAGCFPSIPGVVLPIAYPCNPPAEGSVNEDCDYAPLTWEYIVNVTGYDPREINTNSAEARKISLDMWEANQGHNIYVVVDTNLVCGEDLICNFYGDEETETVRYQLNSSQRGWLNLEGVPPGTDTLRNWVYDGVSKIIHPHIWLSVYGGARTAGYTALDTRLNEIVFIPVFYGVCDNYPQPGEACFDEAHEGKFALEPGQECGVDGYIRDKDNPYFHIIAFAPFFPTCVQRTGNALYKGTDYKTENCPGFEEALKLNPDNKDFKANASALEGYFIIPESIPEPGDETSSGLDLIGIYRAILTQ